MEFKQWLLLKEMPINKMDFIGDWNPEAKRKYGFDKIDAGLLSSEKARIKICHMWRNVPQKINICFVRSKDAYKYREIGEVSLDWVKENLKLDDYTPDSEAINVLYTNNFGTEKIPMTGWAIAHRLSHALRRTEAFIYYQDQLFREMREVIQTAYGRRMSLSPDSSGRYNSIKNPDDEKFMRSFAHSIGTMKSAREKKLVNFYEFFHELLAQYITQGKEFNNSLLRNDSIKFNNLPRELTWSKNRIRANPNEVEGLDEFLQTTLPGLIEYYLDNVLDSAVGKILVM